MRLDLLDLLDNSYLTCLIYLTIPLWHGTCTYQGQARGAPLDYLGGAPSGKTDRFILVGPPPS